MMVKTVKDLSLWRAIAMTLGRIWQQTFVTEAVGQESEKGELVPPFFHREDSSKKHSYSTCRQVVQQVLMLLTRQNQEKL